ncbi:adenosylmethionine-8-amino-7-oxononanoate aminotransferase [Komagataeibacter sucrofermentans DSM 15973]|nr:adenosylmethionine-8-amino-7-oxononanoate aminotransferase [Komagataeibacter sucrofermentans DSM 15973]
MMEKMSDEADILEMKDARYLMHPFTDARANLQGGGMVIDRGEGVFVYDSAGKKYLEAVAGLWSVGLGFSERRLIDAAVRQMEKLPYYHTFTGKSHAPQIELAARLVEMAPVPMSKAFFTNSGSEANDTAIKMIWYRSNALGETKRKKIISRKRGYHGITIASASLTGIPVDHQSFDLPLPGFLHVTAPHYYREGLEGESGDAFSTRLVNEIEALIVAEGPETIAAFFAEPVMGAGGVIVPPQGYWEKLQPVLKKYGIILVADEVICGFGRTGRMFGSQTFDIRPDMMILSKQLSSSYLPISAILMNDMVFEPIADESHAIGAFAHGFTNGGNPTAAAVAIEVLNIMEERDLMTHVSDVSVHFQARLRALGASSTLVGEARGVGLIGALELVMDKATRSSSLEVGQLAKYAFGLLQNKGVIARAMGDTLAFSPPLIITREQVDMIFDGVADVLAQMEQEISSGQFY